MASCDVCNAQTTWEEGTGYTADEFRKMVSMGFGPDDRIINMMTALGRSEHEAVTEWKNGIVAQSSTGWLLCPTCASRASRYMYKPAGAGPAGHVLTETIPVDRLRTPTPSYSPGEKLRPSKLKIVPLLVILIVVVISALMLFLSRSHKRPRPSSSFNYRSVPAAPARQYFSQHMLIKR